MSDGDDMVSSTTDPVSCGISLREQVCADDLDACTGVVKIDVPEDGIGGLSANISSVSPSLANPTLQSLLSSPVTIPGSQLLTGGPDGIQIIAVSNPNELLGTQADSSGRVWQVVHPEMATIIAVAGEPNDLGENKGVPVDLDDTDGGGSNEVSSVSSQDSLLMPPPPQPLPADWPSWAHRIKCCEKIGDSYRGYVESEADLDFLLSYHKQQTQSFWGTRQSPSPAKPSTRLMWKSQYVPFDGIPFVNSGSRAIVMECQYGPRRKGNTMKKQMGDQFINKQVDQFVPGDYKQTCPARIYIKKVRKFPEFMVDTVMEKKSLKMAMDKAFHELKQRGTDGIGQDRYYVQLPTEKAHEFHLEGGNGCPNVAAPVPQVQIPFENEVTDSSAIQRLDPRVALKIREIVSGGETRVYAVRKQLRVFVTRELYHGGEIPERHDLTLFPTVNDLKNHIHQALKDIETGNLPLTAPSVNVEIITSNDGSQSGDQGQMDQSLWQQPSTVGEESAEPVPETVTVTLTQNPGEDGHVISRIETHLSDGSTRISTMLTPETAQLLSRLHPNMFPANLLMQQQMDQAVTSISDPSIPPSNIKVEDNDPLCHVDGIGHSSVTSEADDAIMASAVATSCHEETDMGDLHIVESTHLGGQPVVTGVDSLGHTSVVLDSQLTQDVMESVDTVPVTSLTDDTHNQPQFVTVAVNSETGELILGDAVSALQPEENLA